MDNASINRHEAPKTPSRQQQQSVTTPKLSNWLEVFERRYRILVPRSGQKSSTSATGSTADDTINHIRLLFFRDHDRLSSILSEFDLIYAGPTSQIAKIQWLEQQLVTAYKNTKEMITPKSGSRTIPRRTLPNGATTLPIFGGDVPATPSPMRRVNIESANTSFATTTTETSMWSKQGTNGGDEAHLSATEYDTDDDYQLAPLHQPDFSGKAVDGDGTSRSLHVKTTESRPLQNDTRNTTESRPFQTDTRNTTASRMVDSNGSGARSPPGKQAEEQSDADESVHVRNIPNTLSQHIELPSWVYRYPQYMQVEYLRAAQAGLDLHELDPKDERPGDIVALHKLIDAKNASRAEQIERFQRGFKTDFSNAIMSARLEWTQSKGECPLSLMMMRPKKKMSSSIQRCFGGTRFLSVDVPALAKPPNHLNLNGQKIFLKQRVWEFFARRELHVLGCKWRFLHVKDIKKRGSSDPYSNTGACKVTFFATTTKDSGLRDISLLEVVNWLLPLRQNSSQPACKAFARLDLGMTDSLEGMVLAPSQIDYVVNNITAIDVPDRTEFDDKAFPAFQFDRTFDPSEVVNDGCNWISTYAMNELRIRLGWPYLPSVIQARIFGAKGIWYRDAIIELSHRPAKLIAISQSQKKVEQILENLSDDSFDPACLTINVKKYSYPVRGPSVLYLDFIPILVDRGVSPDALCNLAGRLTTRDIDSLIAALADRRKLRHWFHTRDYMGGDSRRDLDESHGKRLLSDSQKIALMLDVGFEPTTCTHLRNEISKLAHTIFALDKRTFRITLPQSAMVLGIADPTGCLEHDEVYLNFSEAFLDSESGFRWSNLQGMNVLVARNPAIRISDIQKVRAVHKPQLAHLFDVVVFPTKARRPLAGKLQGGDYDGDTFWVCWQPELVTDFKNAPAPYSLPSPEKLGITVEGTTLQEALHMRDGNTIDEQAVADWLVGQANHRMTGNLLGEVTNMHKKVVYHDNDHNSPKARALADLHDCLLDAEKQGYRFDKGDWSNFKRKNKIPSDLRVPAYSEHLEPKEDKADNLLSRPSVKGKTDSILDRIVLQTVEPMFQERLKTMDEQMGIGRSRPLSYALKHFYDDTLSRMMSDEACADLIKMEQKMSDLNAERSKAIADYKAKRTDWNSAIAKCQKWIYSIQPEHPENEVVRAWTQRHGHAPTTWELLRASAVVKLLGDRDMVFRVLWYELCVLQARVSGETFEILQGSYLNLRPRALKNLEDDEDKDAENDGVDDDEDMDDEEYGDDSGFSQLPPC